MENQYYNQNDYNYIANKLNSTKIHSVFWPIIIEIILRRKYEYQLDDKYFHRDVESFITHVNHIYFCKLPKGIRWRNESND